MSRIFAGVVLAAVSLGMAGCDEAKQAANEIVNDQKMKVRNAAQEEARQRADEAREEAVGDVGGKMRGKEGTSDEPEE